MSHEISDDLRKLTNQSAPASLPQMPQGSVPTSSDLIKEQIQSLEQTIKRLSDAQEVIRRI